MSRSRYRPKHRAEKVSSHRSPRHTARGAALVTGVVVGGLFSLPGAQAAAPPAVAAPAQPCVVRSDQGSVPLVHRIDDTTPVTAADLGALAPLAAPSQHTRSRMAAVALPDHVTVPVYVHVIKGTHRGEGSPSGPKRVARIIRILNGGFHARQTTLGGSTRYTFVLRDIDYTKRDGWYHAYLFGPRDRRMKRALHEGGKGDLNLYINGGGSRNAPVLGWSRFPWQYAGTPRLDSVTVNHEAMPGGDIRHYNSGDTVIHETGHWMGLFHTFQGGCGAEGDLVADTAPEGEPSYYCEVGRDTCPQPRIDPVHDFMDYSWDHCMFRFTPGQVARMDRAFAQWRS